MRRLGISIYPEKTTKDKIFNYLEKTSKIGFKRIFSCLLSCNKPKDEIISEFREINEYAHKLGFEVIVDVSPKVFKDLGISYTDLKFFSDIKADGLRLDEGFSGNEESLMTYNPYGLIIEINMSNNTHKIDTIMDYMPNKYKLYGCHNFYPHRYTGLGVDYFIASTERFNKYGIRTAAFVSSQEKDTFGPWPVTDGLITLEEDRDKSIDVQIKHLIALGIDDIIISNCYPSETELEKIKDMDLSLISFKADLEKDLDEIEEKIILEELHFNRGDINPYMIRSTMPRVKYKENEFKAHNTRDIKKGDIIIESSLYGHYKGEMQIALKDMENSKRSSVVGRISEEEIYLLDYIKPWQKFKIIKNNS
ncbi:DUF871 domain-containing protein [Oceanivirga miroungae]|uniref:Outer surface protein n=1 Tax=Oceanivirga miroungae TaxID=1130046 RepID=A0A6I8M7N3_9FUSO|nr:MupG family TIM beta-alpha barrel fold protein [Oceanivirga miroungae]VWL84830.1 hypothetical protein OMES3154_00084 [Oceanivirga miroungae]